MSDCAMSITNFHTGARSRERTIRKVVFRVGRANERRMKRRGYSSNGPPEMLLHIL